LLSVVLGVSLTPTLLSAAGKFSYKDNVFDNNQGCVGIQRGQSLTLNEEVMILLRDGPHTTGKVVGFVPMAKAKEMFSAPLVDGTWPRDNIRNDKPLWEEIGCFDTLSAGDDGYTAIAKIKIMTDDPYGIAIRGLPASAWVLSGLGKPVPMAVKDNPYVELVRHLTGACYAPDSRIEVSKTKELNGRSITQLVIGNMKKVSPEKREQLVKEQWELRTKEYFSDRNKAHWEQHPGYKKERLEKIDSEIKGTDFLESADICRFFLDGKRILKTDVRRVESGPHPSWGNLQYDSSQWPFLRESSLGFISLDEGKNWDAVFMAYGMETTNFMIQSLDSASVTHYHGFTPSFR
jgi:hypothetical protein